MGCSASRPNALLTRPATVEEQQQGPSNSNSNSSSSQSSYSYSDSSSTPISRTLSLPTPLVHHPPLRKGDTNHFVSLTSTTYGSLSLIDHPISRNPYHDRPSRKTLTLAEPEDPTKSSPDSVINTWELMDGLEDFDFVSDFDIVHCPNQKPNSKNAASDCSDLVQSFEFVEHEHEHAEASKPLWKHLSEESLLAKMDPNVGSSYRKALSSRYKVTETPKTISPVVSDNVMSSSSSSSLLSNTTKIVLPDTEDRIVVYYTSLRGIRRTFEDCCDVRNIFKGFRVYVDERDISMDSNYRKELQGALEGKALSLPRVFIRGKYIGGVDEIKQLHEVGDLAKLLEDFEVHDHGFVCEICGDARFVPCPNCNGSRKVFDEVEEKLGRCLDCNENGLIRCPNCCS